MSHYNFLTSSQVNFKHVKHNYKMAQEGIELVTKHLHGHKPNKYTNFDHHKFYAFKIQNVQNVM